MPTTPRSLLDTSVVIGGRFDPIPGDVAISAITLAELQHGVLAAQDADSRAERLRRLSILQQHFSALPVDESVAASYGRLATRVIDSGHDPGDRVTDLLIAATAHAHGARLYTRNASKFTGLEDLVEIISI
jgi:predicted nucleic acid-binding protein